MYACVLQTFCRLSLVCPYTSLLRMRIANSMLTCRHDNGIWYLFYMLRDSYLLQIHKLLKHGDNFQHFPDDDLMMICLCYRFDRFLDRLDLRRTFPRIH